MNRHGVAAVFSLIAATASAEVRQGTFHSPSLGRDVTYAIQLPPSYASATARRYPVLYVLHGLFEGPAFWESRGLAAIVDRRWADRTLPEFLVVAVDGGNSFFVNGPSGRYEDLAAHDVVAHVEATYRAIPGRQGRALWGVSMGGYAALRVALLHPEAFAAVATHSAMLLEKIPTREDGAGRWQMDAFFAVFGNPIDPALWAASDPLALAAKADAKRVPALYFDCGAQDRYGLFTGNQDLDRRLTARGVRHEFALHPGDHGYEYVRTVIDRSLAFVAKNAFVASATDAEVSPSAR